MTLSDKIRIYELSRDLNLENKDILDAAQKLSISVKSHSSSISLDDAKKIKNLINNKNTKNENIISVNKSISNTKTQKKQQKNSELKNIQQKNNNKNQNAQTVTKSLLTKPSISKFSEKSNTPKKRESINRPQIVSTAKTQKMKILFL